MPFEGSPSPPRRYIPKNYGVPGPGREHGSVGRKRHGVDIPRMPFEGGLPPPPRDIPKDYGVIA